MAAMADRLVRTPVAGKPKLLDQVRDVIRRKHYSIRTEQAYIDWIKRFIIYHGKRHPGEMAEEEVAEFLTHLARDLNVAASTCDRMYALSRGRIVAEGPPEAVLTRKLLAEVYGVEAEVLSNPVTGRPMVAVGPPRLSSGGGAPAPRPAPELPAQA